MNNYFRLFHEKIKAFSNRVLKADMMVFNQEEFYSDLFKIQAEKHGGKDKSISNAQICHWLSEKEYVPEWIAVDSVNDHEGLKDDYACAFRDYIQRGLFQTDEIEKTLKNKMLDLLNDWSPELFEFSEECDLADVLAMTLVTALTFDFTLRKNTLDPVLYDKLCDKVSFCKKHNFAFKTPYILSVLLEDKSSLLWRALNRISAESETEGPGGGDIFGGRIHNYIKSMNHRDTYEEVNLDTEKLLVIARVLSYQEGKCLADEFDLCCALRHFQSSSIKQMQPFTGIWWRDCDSWRQFLKKCQKEAPKTSDLYI